MVGQKPNTWAGWLPMAEWWYNTTHHSAIGMSPYQALYCSVPPSINYHQLRSQDSAVSTLLRERTAIQQLLKENLSKAQERMKWFADKKRSDREFTVGTEVFLKLQPYRQLSLNQRKNHKLSAKYYGPYVVTERIGPVAYKLALPAEAKIHNVFHVSQLKKRLGDSKVVQTTLPSTDNSGVIQPRPMAVLDRMLIKKGNRPATKVLVQWENGSPNEATWELWEELMVKFPDFHP